MHDPLLKVENISAYYGGIRALDGVTLEVKRGEIVAVLGANGTGKSTLLKCLSREMKVKDGSISFDGKPLAGKPYNVVESDMVIVPEGRQIFYKLRLQAWNCHRDRRLFCESKRELAGFAASGTTDTVRDSYGKDCAGRGL